MENSLAQLYKTQKTVFTTKDLSLIWCEKNKDNLKSKIFYYVKKGSLLRLSKGIFAVDKDYNLKELANSIYSPSYISFETVLREAGVIFQYYEVVFLAGPWSKKREIDGQEFIFRKLKDTVLYNQKGIVNKKGYSQALPERAFLDMIYAFPNYYFDNLRGINWEKCEDIISIYKNKQLIKRFEEYRKNNFKD